MKNYLVAVLSVLFFASSAMSQDINDVSLSITDSAKTTSESESSKVTESFASIRVLNNHSIEMIPKRSLEFIVAHKFGDLAGSGGGFPTYFGLDNLADVRIAFEYGLNNSMNIGLGRSKGIGLLTQVADGYFKYSALQQKTSGMPISLTWVSSMAIPYAKATADLTSITSYPTFLHRLIFTNQILVARKFSDRITLQINFGYNHRNYVSYLDRNGLLFVGGSGRFRLTKSFGLLIEYNQILNRPNSITYTNHLAFGIELLTGGHAFILSFSNSTGVTENLFIPGTTQNWLKGQFRFGFSINRRFKL